MSFFAGRVFWTETATTQDWHPEHAEIIRSHWTDFGAWFPPGWRRRCACNMKPAVPLIVVKRTVGADRCGLYARNFLHSLEQLGPECILLLVSLVLRLRQQDFEIYNATRIEAQRCILCVP